MVFSRRRLLCGASALSLSIPTFLRALAAEAAATNTVLVLYEFNGGNDAFNMIVPQVNNGQTCLSSYGDYMDQRANIAYPQSQLAATAFDPNPATPAASATTFAFDPRMTAMRSLYGSGQVALLMGIGIPNTSLDREGHEEAQYTWATGTINSFRQSNIGWLGQSFDQFGSATGALPPLIALDGSQQLAMNGSKNSPLVIGGDLSYFSPNTGYGQGSSTTRLAALAGNDAYATPATPIELSRALATQTMSFVGAVGQIASAEKLTDYVTTYAFTPGGTPTNSYVKSQLEQTARLILGGAPTRAYYIRQGGYDTHSGQVAQQPPLLGEFSESVQQFFAYIQAKNPTVAANVVLMTVSDFGRRAYSNASSGTDHGTLTVSFAIGQRVKGGVYGQYPAIAKSALDPNGDVQSNLAPNGVAIDFRSQLSDAIIAMGGDPTPILGKVYPSVGFM